MGKVIDLMRPEGWSDSDISEASIEVERFTFGKGYAWLDNYISGRIAMEQRELVPPRPEDVTHGRFIALSARCRALEAMHDGITILVGWKEKKDEELENRQDG